ncbi:HNH endonuclease signature motif containing protein [Microbacterium nymphoidis]|uniref:HNH endonuclease signature motif containing protein n=1 Tax=Microbacterium nymphoidis TaxID=2898586 RepID=UPI001E442472|nr:HNH endonuclease signature motif containing protein [Microbacterium nymphoidis]MCD2497036.1 HNH endonuclease [Microbacterium nymphoidis]
MTLAPMNGEARANGFASRSSNRTELPPSRGSAGRVLGPAMATPEVLNSYIDAVAAVTRSRAATEAMEAALLADLVALSGASGESSHSDLGLRSLAAEVGAVIHISDRTVQRRMSDAYRLVREFPAVHAAVSTGEILMAHAHVVVNAGAPITAGPAREAFIERALTLARVESPNRLRAMLASVAEEVQQIGITERHRIANTSRAVWITDDVDGMSTLHAYLPSVLAHGVKDRLDQMAHALRGQRGDRPRGFRPAAQDPRRCANGANCSDSARAVSVRDGATRANGTRTVHGANGAAGDVERAQASRTTANVVAGEGAAADPEQSPYKDTRTVDQMRADLLADLLLTSAPTSVDTAVGAIRATVAVMVPALTLMGITHTGAELDGVVPIDADTARQLAGGAVGWDRLLTDPIHGAVLATDRYRPTAEMKRFLTHSHQHCRHPGCRVPVRRTDLDHNHEWASGGKTDVANLAPLCRRHHTLKTSAGWSITPLAGGDLEFVSALGRSHLEMLTPRNVGFVPTGPATDERSADSNTGDRYRLLHDHGDPEPPW